MGGEKDDVMTQQPDRTHADRDGEEQSLAEQALRSHLDEEDYEIFRALNEDGRMSDTELAERVGLSRTAVRRRREKLLNEGLLEILGVIVLQEGDFQYGLVLVGLDPQVTDTEWKTMIDRFVDEDLIYSVDAAMGEYDLVLHVWHESFNELKSYILGLFDDLDRIEEYTFVPVAKTWKAWDKVLDRPEL